MKGERNMKNHNLNDLILRYGAVKFLQEECGVQIVNHNKSFVCPYHGQTEKNQKGLNTSINLETGLWYCFVCGEGGNLFTLFRKAHTEMSMSQAVKHVLKLCGVEDESSMTAEDIRMRFVAICHDILMKDEDRTSEAWGYIKSRGITEKSVKKFYIGVGSQEAIDKMKAEGISVKMMLEADIFRKSKKSGKMYFPWANRIVLMAGNNIYGRNIHKDDKTPPHLYTISKNKLFNEGSCYGGKKGLDGVFVVESIFDAITVQQYVSSLKLRYGVVATLGTKGVKNDALVTKIASYNPAEVVIIPDCDPWKKNHTAHAVGQLAGLSKAKAFEDAGIPIRMLVLDEDSDPNDLSKNRVKGRVFLEKFENALPPVMYNIWCIKHYVDLETEGGRQLFINRVNYGVKKYAVVLSMELIKYIAKEGNLDEFDVKMNFGTSIKKSLVRTALLKMKAEGVQSIDDALVKLEE